jgi:hypothetical protein
VLPIPTAAAEYNTNRIHILEEQTELADHRDIYSTQNQDGSLLAATECIKKLMNITKQIRQAMQRKLQKFATNSY